MQNYHGRILSPELFCPIPLGTCQIWEWLCASQFQHQFSLWMYLLCWLFKNQPLIIIFPLSAVPGTEVNGMSLWLFCRAHPRVCTHTKHPWASMRWLEASAFISSFKPFVRFGLLSLVFKNVPSNQIESTPCWQLPQNLLPWSERFKGE